jgi:quercetin dioxygenase-like cupin family protein
VPFTLRNLKEDLEDVGSNFDGAPDLEFRLATRALELERSGLGYQRLPPGYRFPYGHTHKEQEEVYVVPRGSGRMKLDDEIIELQEWDAVRVPPGTWRGYEAGPEGSRSSSSAPPISARTRATMSKAGATGGLSSRAGHVASSATVVAWLETSQFVNSATPLQMWSRSWKRAND